MTLKEYELKIIHLQGKAKLDIKIKLKFRKI